MRSKVVDSLLFLVLMACRGMRGSREFCQRGSNIDNVLFLVDDEGR